MIYYDHNSNNLSLCESYDSLNFHVRLTTCLLGLVIFKKTPLGELDDKK